MVRLLGPDYEIRRIKFSVGKTLEEGEESKSGLYAIQSTIKPLTLRIALIQEAAEGMRDIEWRYLAECWIDKIYPRDPKLQPQHESPKEGPSTEGMGQGI